MDLETENRIAAILMKEAAELRRQAEREGVHVYLERPKVRARPNSRFLTSTVLGVQQTNLAVEVNEMWRVRQKELELDDRLRGKSRCDGDSRRNKRDDGNVSLSASKRLSINEYNTRALSSSGNGVVQSCYSREDEGLRDEEIEEFLHSRVKRGRGAVGSRMDDTGPYLPTCSDSEEKLPGNLDTKAHRVVLRPEKPSSLKSYESSEEELDKERRKKPREAHSKSSDKKHSRRHRSKEKGRDMKRKRNHEKKSKH